MASFLERAIAYVAPGAALRRAAARRALGLSARTYEAAQPGRRTDHWPKAANDANAVIGPGLALIRTKARHLVRNNPFAESALDTISTHTVGPYGIAPKFRNKRAEYEFRQWAESTDCDADGVNDFAGLQDLAIRTIAESGEVLIRRRPRFARDGFRVPVQIQILEPDYLDTSKTMVLGNGGRIVHGVEFDAIGRRVAYWLFRDHPGSASPMSSLVSTSVRVPASEVTHAFKSTRAGQARAISWFAPVLLKLADFDEYDDASLMKQKIAACLAVFTRDVEGPDSPIGRGPEKSDDPLVDTLEPGMITRLNPGEDIEVVQPPSTNEYDAFAKSQLRAIATGLGLTYEDLTGDYTGLPYSAARMSRIRHWAKVERWRWRIVIPRVCRPMWQWWAEAAVLAGVLTEADAVPPIDWVAPPPPMLDPDKEVAANRRAVRSGQKTPQMVLRELGLDPEEVIGEIAAWNKAIDKAGLILDSDPRTMSEAGQRHSTGAGAPADAGASTPPADPAADPPADAATAEENLSTDTADQGADA